MHLIDVWVLINISGKYFKGLILRATYGCKYVLWHNALFSEYITPQSFLQTSSSDTQIILELTKVQKTDVPSVTFLKTTTHHSISDWHKIVLQWEYSPSHLVAVLSFFFFFFRVPEFLELIMIHQRLEHAIWALRAKSLIWKTQHFFQK